MSAALEYLKTLDRDCISPRMAAPVMGCDPYTISLMARDCPELLPFPVFRLKNRTRIPLKPFIAYFEKGGM